MQLIINSFEEPANLRMAAEFLTKMAAYNEANPLGEPVSAVPSAEAQPAVAENTGTTASGSTLSPEGSGVSGEAGALGVPGADKPASPAPEKKTRKAKVTEAAAPSQGNPGDSDAQSTPEPGAPSAAAPTIDEVRAALQSFTTAKGMPAAIELLKSYNAGRISELKPEQYADFVKKCNV